MKIFKVKHKVYDIFLDFNTFPTGFEPSCWLRIYQDRSGKFHQIDGIKLPSYKFTQIIKTAEISIKIKERTL